MLDSGLTKVIGFCGFKGSGKDTAADYLVGTHGYSKISLAHPLKLAAQTIFGFSDDALWGSSEKREIPDTRYPFRGLNPVDGTPLKKVARDVNHYWFRESDGEWFPQYVTPRVALQTLGTEFGRRMYQNLWVDACLNYIISTGNPLHAIPDVRFANELEGIQTRGGVVIRLLRGKRESNHPSELELERIPHQAFDFVVDNRGSKEELYRSLDKVISEISG